MTRTTHAWATLIAAAFWAPAWPFASLIGPAPLAAQQSAQPSTPGAGSRHVGEDTDTSDDDEKSDDDDKDDKDDGNADKSSHWDHHGSGLRVVHVARMMHAGHDTAAQLHVNLDYGTGRLSIAPADAPWLYDVRLNYAPEGDAPIVSFDTLGHRLHVGNSGDRTSHSFTFGNHSRHDDDELRVAIGRTVPVDIALTFGAGEVRAQLGGLSVRQLKIQTGASDAQVSFDRPDPIPLERVEFDVGAAGFKATGLGNAHAQRVIVKAGAGDVDLDFSGPWTGDATLDITAALGAVHVHVPPGVIVNRMGGKTIIGSLEDATGGATSPQKLGGPMYHLRVTSTMTMGSVEFDRKTSN